METDNNIQYWINLAIEIASKAHSGQFRNDKKTPYINHPLAVAKLVPDRLKPIAILHDVPEDTNVTVQDLINAGFPKYITDGVALMTHEKNVTNMAYWTRMLDNADVVTVKIADIKTNLGDNPSDHARQKYARALKLFADAGYSV